MKSEHYFCGYQRGEAIERQLRRLIVRLVDVPQAVNHMASHVLDIGHQIHHSPLQVSQPLGARALLGHGVRFLETNKRS